jgi:hypothetical protein
MLWLVHRSTVEEEQCGSLARMLGDILHTLDSSRLFNMMRRSTRPDKRKAIKTRRNEHWLRSEKHGRIMNKLSARPSRMQI